MSDVTKQETVEAVLDALMAESRDDGYHDMWQQGVRYAVAEISDALAAEADLEKMRRALAPFSLEADNWHDDVPDDYCPLMAEPGAEQTNPGSEAVFSIGDLRRAREALSPSPRLSEPR